MNYKKAVFPAGIVLLLMTLVGCNLPMSQAPTPFVFPTPNLTMTALFKPPVVIPPTVTTQPEVIATEVSQATTLPTQTQPAPTATQAPPTATSVPATATNTSIPTDRRQSPSAVAPFVSTAPTIDGDWGEWNNSKQYPANFVVWGASNWKDENDLGSSYQVAWDNNNLYLAVKVHDDHYVQGATGKDLYKGDSVELLLDTNVQGDFFSQALSGDDYQLGFSPGNPLGKNTEPIVWYPSSKAGKPSGVKLASVAGEGIWRLEAAIPWAVFGVSPANGLHLGFAVSVSDNDKSGENLQQSMVSSAPNRSLVDPTTWGDLTLTK